MTTIAYFDCFSGISGNMVLGALLDAGLELERLETELARLPISGYKVKVEAVKRRGIRGTHVEIEVSEQGVERHLHHVEEIIQYESPSTVAAVLLETQTGAAGFFAPPDGYFQRLREICDQYDILLIVDEVMVGFGRTGKWFAIQHYDVVPDLMSLAKDLSDKNQAHY